MDWLHLADLQCASYAEEWPNTDHVDKVVRTARLQRAGVPPGAAIWIVLDCQNGSAGMARVTPQRREASLILYVSPKSRGSGVGQFLLRAATRYARKIGVGALVSWTTSSIPQGDRFADFFQGRMTNREWSMQVTRSDLDLVALSRWRSAAKKNDVEFEITQNSGSAEHAESLLDLRMMIAATYGFKPGSDYLKRQIRSADGAMRKDGIEHWVLRAFSMATGSIVGYTEATWDPSQPKVFNHTSIAVVPAYRSRGIAMSMKATLIEKLLEKKPSLQWIRGVNSSSAVRMIRRNRELGYMTHHERKRWLFSINTLRKRIQELDF